MKTDIYGLSRPARTDQSFSNIQNGEGTMGENQQAYPYPDGHKPLTITVKRFCEVVGIGRTSCFALIAEGQIDTVLIKGRRLILVESMESLIARSRDKGRS